MERLKVELVNRAREVGDSGTSELHRALVEAFLLQLQRWMTPAAIETFTAAELRTPYFWFITRYMELEMHDFTAAGDELMGVFHVSRFPRSLASPPVLNDPKVVSIFGKS